MDQVSKVGCDMPGVPVLSMLRKEDCDFKLVWVTWYSLFSRVTGCVWSWSVLKCVPWSDEAIVWFSWPNWSNVQITVKIPSGSVWCTLLYSITCWPFWGRVTEISIHIDWILLLLSICWRNYFWSHALRSLVWFGPFLTVCFIVPKTWVKHQLPTLRLRERMGRYTEITNWGMVQAVCFHLQTLWPQCCQHQRETARLSSSWLRMTPEQGLLLCCCSASLALLLLSCLGFLYALILSRTQPVWPTTGRQIIWPQTQPGHSWSKLEQLLTPWKGRSILYIRSFLVSKYLLYL